MGIRNFPVITMGENTGQVTVVNSSSFKVLPTMSNGDLPKYVYVGCAGGTQTNICFFSPCHGSQSGNTDNLWAFTPGSGIGQVFKVLGHDRWSRSHTGDGTSSLYIIPLEDF